ncbi:MAG TPA: DUF503 domain-containing protein [Bacillota bacterium]|nr:DUF503 domain-containing protein [Bacillota bacterium]HOL09037.1 DUF503 domain-containing protein [Bacillota bacterium]HPO96712.1 DUF503 domain-containing protein [Bacillota bacterium]
MIQIQLNIPGALSLKDKRQVMQSLLSKVRQKFNVSVIESDFQNQWSHAELGLAFLAANMRQLEQIEQSIVTYIENNYPIEINQILVTEC